MCCPGCAAVASMIIDSGLDNFYAQRTAFSIRPEAQVAVNAEQFAVYDNPELVATFSVTTDTGTTQSALLIGGITCAACTWLIERSLGELSGVRSTNVNLGQHRLDIEYDASVTPPSAVFAQLASLGYRPAPFHEDALKTQLHEEARRDLRRLAVAGLGMMQVGMFAIALHAGEMQGMDPRFENLLRWVSLPVAGFVVFYSARSFFSTAWRHLKAHTLVMDLPVALAIGLAFLASAWATLTGGGDVYFDSVVMFTFFLLLGRYVEKRARLRSADAWQSLQSQLPDAVTLQRDGQWVSYPRIQTQPGDILLIKPGQTIPADCTVQQGNSSVREDAFTGESHPRAVVRGDAVFAGTVNLEGNLQATITTQHQHSRLAALQGLINTAATGKPGLAKLADTVAAWFVGAILLIAASTAVSWYFIDPQRALWVTLSVLVISCPCALALATPTALTSAANALRSIGVHLKGENGLESLANCTHLLFDKTGTLTQGQLSIAEIELHGSASRDDVLAICAALQRPSSHPVAAAFESIEPCSAVTDIEYIIGSGMHGRNGEQRYRMGSLQFCRQACPQLTLPVDDTLLWVALVVEDELLAWLGFSDQVRPEAQAVIDQARQDGLEIALVTGDGSHQAQRLARELGIDNVRSAQSPNDKLRYVRELQASGANVCMVGDGVNDGPVLRRANVSFAVPGASDLARAQADFVITAGSLLSLGAAFAKARACRTIIRQNLGWAITYNVCAVPLAAMGIVPPWVAALGMSASSLLVVGNSARLARARND